MRPGVHLGLVAAFWLAAGCSAGATPQPSASPMAATASPSQTATLAPATAIPASPTPTVHLLDEPAGVEYSIPPTFQHAWPGAAVVYFELSRAAEVAVLVAEGEGGGWRIALVSPIETRHLLTLEGLTPGAAYRVAVGVPDEEGNFRQPAFQGETWGPLRLKVPLEEPVSTRLIVIGDSGYGEEVTRGMAEAAAALSPDATIHTGDLVYLGQQEGSAAAAYGEKFYQALAPLLQSGPIYPVLGNHELDGPVRAAGIPYYYTSFPLIPELCCDDGVGPERREWYSAAWGGWQFVFLNSQAFYGHGDRAAQDVWLDQRLGDPDFVFTVPVMHIAAFSAGAHVGDGAPLRSSWHPRFAAAGVPLVLSGHDHNYQRIVVDGVTYVVSGGGSGVLYRRTVDLAGGVVFDSRTHFLVVDLSAGGAAVQALAPDGTLIEEFTVP